MQNTFSTLVKDTYSTYKTHYKELIIASLMGTVMVYGVLLLLIIACVMLIGGSAVMDAVSQNTALDITQLPSIPLIIVMVIGFIGVFIASILSQLINLITAQHALHNTSITFIGIKNITTQYFTQYIKLFMAVLYRTISPLFIAFIVLILLYAMTFYAPLAFLKSTIIPVIAVFIILAGILYMLYMFIKYAFSLGYMIDKTASVADSIAFAEALPWRTSFTYVCFMIAFGIVLALITQFIVALIGFIIPSIALQNILPLLFQIALLTPISSLFYMLITSRLDTSEAATTTLESDI